MPRKEHRFRQKESKMKATKNRCGFLFRFGIRLTFVKCSQEEPNTTSTAAKYDNSDCFRVTQSVTQHNMHNMHTPT